MTRFSAAGSKMTPEILYRFRVLLLKILRFLEKHVFCSSWETVFDYELDNWSYRTGRQLLLAKAKNAYGRIDICRVKVVLFKFFLLKHEFVYEGRHIWSIVSLSHQSKLMYLSAAGSRCLMLKFRSLCILSSVPPMYSTDQKQKMSSYEATLIYDRFI